MKNDTTLILISTVCIIFFAALSTFIVSKAPTTLAEQPTGSWACAADFMMCPDGTEVWRTPPYCLFAVCPN